MIKIKKIANLNLLIFSVWGLFAHNAWADNLDNVGNIDNADNYYQQAPHYNAGNKQMVMCCRLEPLPEPLQQELARISHLFKEQKIDEALAINDAFIPKIEHLLAKDKRQAIASLPEISHVILNLSNASAANKDAYLVSRDWMMPYYLRAYGYTVKGKPKLAKKYLDEALQFSPFDVRTLNERGLYFSNLKDWKAAKKDYQKALEMARLIESNPKENSVLQRRALRGLGYIAVEQKQWDKAESLYREALRLDKNDEHAKVELMYISKNRPKKAVQATKK